MEKKQHPILLAAQYAIVALVFLFCAFKIIEILSIRRVFDQNVKAFNGSMQIAHEGLLYTKRIHVHKYVDGLKRINTSYCPKKFQQAWHEFVQAWEQEEELGMKLSQMNKSGAGKSGNITVNTLGVEAAMSKARQDVEDTALEYGVRVQR